MADGLSARCRGLPKRARAGWNVLNIGTCKCCDRRRSSISALVEGTLPRSACCAYRTSCSAPSKPPPAPDYSTTLNDTSQPLPDRLAAFGRAAAADDPADTAELAMFLEFFAALLRAPAALQRYTSGRERRLQQLADADDADSSDLAAGVTPIQPWAIGQAMLVGLQIERRLAPRLITPEVFERAFGLLASLYQEQ
jgi:hypothetical protein